MGAVYTIQLDPTPRPVASYAELWRRDPKTLNAWCVKGWVPGSYKHPSGEWWVRPLELIGFDPSTVDDRPVRREKGKNPSYEYKPVNRLTFPESGREASGGDR